MVAAGSGLSVQDVGVEYVEHSGADGETEEC